MGVKQQDVGQLIRGGRSGEVPWEMTSGPDGVSQHPLFSQGDLCKPGGSRALGAVSPSSRFTAELSATDFSMKTTLAFHTWF